MIKNLVLSTFITIVFFNAAIAQENCEVAKAELEKEVTFYKEALKLQNSKIVAEEDNIIVKINSVIGKSDKGTITIVGLVENNGAIRSLHLNAYKTTIVDSKGNNYKGFNAEFGNTHSVKDFQKNLPMKFVITVSKIAEEMPVINNLAIVFTTSVGKEYPKFIFKNLDVKWE